MTKAETSNILYVFRRVVEDQRARRLPDQELLQRFLARNDEADFLAILRRHGPMVLGVCRTLLASEADAEDAFQATFLIFARGAMSIRKTASLASWLHGVAYRTARRAQTDFARRHRHERFAARPEATSTDELSWLEVQQVLHEELSGLSERYRAPLTLYYLQGKTLDESATQLGVAKTTLKTRLERGRALLRVRLVRRGLAPAGALLAAAWPAAATAGLPVGLPGSTATAALSLAAGQAPGLLSAKVAALTRTGLKALLMTKLKTMAAVLTVLAAIGLGLGGLAYTAAARKVGPENDGNLPAPAAAQRPPEELHAIAALRAVGGRIILDKTQPGEPVVGIYLLSADVNESHFRLLKQFKSLTTLVLPEGITDAGWREIRELKTLERLRPHDRGYSEVALRGLGQLTNLHDLELDLGGNVKDVGPTLHALQALTNLRVLKLEAWRGSGEGLEELRAFRKLRQLDLSNALASNARLRRLPVLDQLEELALGKAVDDAGLRDVAKLKSLKILRMTSSLITDAGLAELKPLAALRQLFLSETHVTKAGIADLAKALPGLEISTSADQPIIWADYKRITGMAKVLDATTLLMEDGTRVRLHLQAPKPGERGAKEAAEFLAALIRDRTVDCFLIESQLAYVGYVRDVNIEHAMVINGWARGKGAPATIAQEQKRGLWSDAHQDPNR